tara:strand:- start:203 stop:484 length:282 start_codon:yes stop_codon:yes gene_type:complete
MNNLTYTDKQNKIETDKKIKAVKIALEQTEKQLNRILKGGFSFLSDRNLNPKLDNHYHNNPNDLKLDDNDDCLFTLIINQKRLLTEYLEQLTK